jgi:hypothetical protein
MQGWRTAACGLAIALAFWALPPADARAAWTVPVSLAETPPGLDLTPRQAVARALRAPEVRERRGQGAALRATAAYDLVLARWQIDFRRRGEILVRVELEDATGAIRGAWSGEAIDWQMARGEPGQFGRKLNAPYIWLPLCVLFLLPFLDLRRPLRLLHLDLLAVLAFGVSHIWFNRGEIGTSVPLAYPVLVYLLGRMAWIGFRGRPLQGPLVPHLPVVALVVGLVFLLAFRFALNVTDSGVTDVGYAGVIGADRIVRGDPIYAGSFPEDNPFGNTYGPVNYLAYIPFELAFPWSGRWDDLPAAHAASLAFDLLTVLGLLLLGRRLRAGPEGTALGVALAFAWASCPYTAFVLQSNTNDALVALLLVFALVAMAHPARRGVLVGLAGAAKLVPLALVPLMAGGLRSRQLAAFALGFAAAVLVTTLPFVWGVDLRGVWDRTFGAQLSRNSPFSIWGQEPSLEWLHQALKVGVAGFAVLLFVRPRTRDVTRVAALGAAVLLALEVALEHWFYFYIVWFLPYLLVALFGRYEPTGRSSAQRATPY